MIFQMDTLTILGLSTLIRSNGDISASRPRLPALIRILGRDAMASLLIILFSLFLPSAFQALLYTVLPGL